VDAVAPGLGADIDHQIARPGGGRIKDTVGPHQPDAHRVDQDVAVIGRIETAFAADRRHPDAIAVAADAADDAGQQVARLRVVGAAEAERIQQRDRPRAHCEHVAQDAADPGRGALIRLDERGVVVALDLEDDRLAVADIDDPGILAGTADDARTAGRQAAQPHLGRFVRAMLAPHRREDAQFGQVRGAPEDRAGAGEFVGAQPVLGRQFGRDIGAVHHCHSGARARRGNPESRNTGLRSWIPGSPHRGAPE
jgi:hypothetical protein